MDRAAAVALDEASPLAGTRDRFDLPDGLIYLDGNSLGALPRGVADRVASFVRTEWGTDLIRSWNDHGWWDLPLTVGDKLTPVIGAGPGTVVAGDGVTVQLYKALGASARLDRARTVIVSEPGNFPTDSYVIDAVAEQFGLTVRWWDRATVPDIREVLDTDVAVVALCHVDYRTGFAHDGSGVTDAAHDVGALMLWDLCHSAGALDVRLEEWRADLAVGCTYKYLNAGAGSPGYVYVDRKLQHVVENPIPGWHGHAAPFALEPDYRPARGIARMRTGSSPIIALTALDAALDAFVGVAMTDVRATSLSLTDLFIALTEERLGPFGVEPVTERQHSRRGSQVCLRVPADAYGFVQALIARDVIGDFREPDLARFGFAPLYVRHADVWDAVDHMAAVLEHGEHLLPEHTTRRPVT
jgi:kynureninase